MLDEDGSPTKRWEVLECRARGDCGSPRDHDGVVGLGKGMVGLSEGCALMSASRRHKGREYERVASRVKM
jgi:hypothetical protein